MADTRKIQESNDRQPQSARVQRYFVGTTLAILLCPCSNGKVFAVTIDLEDLDRVLAAGPWSVSNFDKARGKVRLYCHSTRRQPNKKTLYLHRFILNAQPGVEVDHQWNRSLDNRKSEIRLASKSLNQRNKRKSGPDNHLGFRGVCGSRSGRFIARVWVNNKSKQLGTFDTPELAGAAVRQFLIDNGAEYAATA